MFCPVCKVEYRSGFSRCADCYVDLLEELSPSPPEKNADISVAHRTPQNSFERTKSVTKSVLTFGLHQFIGMYGIPYTAPIVFSLGFKFLFLFGHSYPRKVFYSLVSESPYFPVQIIFALILGWLLGRVLRNRSMVWVWVLPLTILSYSVVTSRVLVPTSVFAGPGAGQSWFSHYFGWGCRPADHCLDQLLITMPFYSSLAYSLGAALARRTLGFASSRSTAHFRTVTVAGFIILGGIFVDLAVSTKTSGWHTAYLLFALLPTGLGAVLLYAGSTFNRRPVSNA